MKIKILFIALISLFASISANAQVGTTNFCIPESVREGGCMAIKFSKIISLPQFPDCKFEVSGIYLFCKDECHLTIQSFDIPDYGCNELLEKLKDDDQVFHTEFKKWFEKQMFYTTAIELFNETRSINLSNEQLYCPNGYVSFTGYFGQCIAYAWYQREVFGCPGCKMYKIEKIDCSGYPCCELKINMCMDKATGAIKITEVSTPIPSECAYSEPYPVPIDRTWGSPIWVGKCSPVCTNKYPYNSPAPTK